MCLPTHLIKSIPISIRSRCTATLQARQSSYRLFIRFSSKYLPVEILILAISYHLGAQILEAIKGNGFKSTEKFTVGIISAIISLEVKSSKNVNFPVTSIPRLTDNFHGRFSRPRCLCSRSCTTRVRLHSWFEILRRLRK